MTDALWAVAPALAFLLVGVPLAALLDELGFFDSTAALVQRRWPDVPVLALWALAAVTTVVLNLDTTVVLLTPLYVRLARRAGADPLPLALVPLLLAAFASSVLPISNLTTLIATEQLHLSVGDVVRHLALPSAAAVVAGWLVYRRRHPTHLQGAAPVAEIDVLPLAIGGPIVVALLVGVTVGPSFGIPPWAVVLVADAVLVIVTRVLPWGTVPVGTAAAVGAVAALVGWVVSPSLMDPVRRLTSPLAVVGVALLGTATANVVNNIPATLLVVDGQDRAVPATWGWLLGVNVGSVLLPIGALANLLWLRIVRAEGIEVDLRRYLRLVVVIAVPALVAAVAVQALQGIF